ncbi:MAG: hypothetical protein K2Q97_19215 [Burkholderiaceae bacterium]|nr:hypothetical protein [Burkholderiaceae bacterium]
MTHDVQQWVAMALVALAAVYVVRRWVHVGVLQRLGGGQSGTAQAGGCGACSSCGGCATKAGASSTPAEASAQPIYIVPRRSKPD